MRTFVLKLKDFDFKAEIKLTLNNKVVWSNQKKCETNSQKFKLRAPSRIILLYDLTDFIVKLASKEL